MSNTKEQRFWITNAESCKGHHQFLNQTINPRSSVVRRYKRDKMLQDRIHSLPTWKLENISQIQRQLMKDKFDLWRKSIKYLTIDWQIRRTKKPNGFVTILGNTQINEACNFFPKNWDIKIYDCQRIIHGAKCKIIVQKNW